MLEDNLKPGLMASNEVTKKTYSYKIIDRTTEELLYIDPYDYWELSILELDAVMNVYQNFNNRKTLIIVE